MFVCLLGSWELDPKFLSLCLLERCLRLRESLGVDGARLYSGDAAEFRQAYGFHSLLRRSVSSQYSTRAVACPV